MRTISNSADHHVESSFASFIAGLASAYTAGIVARWLRDASEPRPAASPVPGVASSSCACTRHRDQQPLRPSAQGLPAPGVAIGVVESSGVRMLDSETIDIRPGADDDLLPP